MASLLETAFTKTLGRLSRFLAFDLPGPGGRLIPASWPINLAKAGTLPLDLFLCWYFDNWSTSAMLIVSQTFRELFVRPLVLTRPHADCAARQLRGILDNQALCAS